MKSTGGNDVPDRAADRAALDAAPGPVAPDVAALGGGHVVLRHCTLCEWQTEVVERGLENDPLCPWCFSRTARGAVLGVVIPEGAAGQKNVSATSLGRLGGLKGGPARAQKLSARRRREIASKAARARWDKTKHGS